MKSYLMKCSCPNFTEPADQKKTKNKQAISVEWLNYNSQMRFINFT